MTRPICPLLHNRKHCKVLNLAYVISEDVENICKNSEAFPYCIHYTTALKKEQMNSKWNSSDITRRHACPKCNSTHITYETLFLLLKETQTPCEFKAYICGICGYTELYRSQ